MASPDVIPHIEYLDELTIDGERTGRKVPRSVAHLQGIPHSCIHLWLIDPLTKQVVLQRRAGCKESWPLYYDISCAGHISAGEGPYTSCVRELFEELGLHLLFIIECDSADADQQVGPETSPQESAEQSQKRFTQCLDRARRLDEQYFPTSLRSSKTDGSQQHIVQISSIHAPTQYTTHTLSYVDTLFQHSLVRKDYIDNEHAVLFVLEMTPVESPDPQTIPVSLSPPEVEISSDDPHLRRDEVSLPGFPHPFTLQPEELHTICMVPIQTYVQMQLHLHQSSANNQGGHGEEKQQQIDREVCSKQGSTQPTVEFKQTTPVTRELLQEYIDQGQQPPQQSHVSGTPCSNESHEQGSDKYNPHQHAPETKGSSPDSLPPSPPCSPHSIDDINDIHNPHWLVPIDMAPGYMLQVFGNYL